MDNALLEPTEMERVVTAELRVHCQRLLRESAQKQESVSLALSLRPKDIDGLLRRDDWTLPARPTPLPPPRPRCSGPGTPSSR